MELSNNVNHTDVLYSDFLTNPNQNEIVFDPIGENELREIVLGLSDAAPGWDDVPMSVVKRVIEYIKSPLLHIFNQ